MAIFVLFLLTSMGGALLFMADSDVKMNKAGLRAKAAFYQAEAALENARNVLRVRNLASASTSSFTDELAAAAGTDLSLQLNPATIAPTYDSAGRVTGFTGYGDDVPLVPFTAFNGGWHAAFLTNDPIDGRTNTTDTNDRLMITAIGATSDRAVEVVQAIVDREALPSLPATITMLGPTPSGFSGAEARRRRNTTETTATARAPTWASRGFTCRSSAASAPPPSCTSRATMAQGRHVQFRRILRRGHDRQLDDDRRSASGPPVITPVDRLLEPPIDGCHGQGRRRTTCARPFRRARTSASSTINTVTFVEGDLDLGPGDSGKGSCG